MRKIKSTTRQSQFIRIMKKTSALVLIMACLSGMTACNKADSSSSTADSSKTQSESSEEVSEAGEKMLLANHISSLMEENDTMVIKTETEVDDTKQIFYYYVYHEDGKLALHFKSTDGDDNTATTLNIKDGANYIASSSQTQFAFFPDEDTDAATAAYAEGYLDYDKITSDPVLEDNMYVVEGYKLFEESDYYCRVEIKYYFDAESETIQKIEATAYDENDGIMYSQTTTFSYNEEQEEVDNSAYEQIANVDKADKREFTFVINPGDANEQVRKYKIKKDVTFAVHSDVEGNEYKIYIDESCSEEYDYTSELKEGDLTFYVKKSES